MSNLIFSPNTEEILKRILAKPPHALLLVAPHGTGKGTLAKHLAAQLLNLDYERLPASAHYKHLEPHDGKALSIEEVRDITHFLMLRSTNAASTARVVIIEHAGALTTQAQNALLKTIEEPPAGTVLILTASSELDVLSTIRSRAQLVIVDPPDNANLKAYFIEQGYKDSAIDKALLMSDGLIGLAQALLADDESHPLVAAANTARDLLQKSLFERLIMIDDLVKRKQDWLDTLFILQRIAQINLQKQGMSKESVKKWHGILKAALEAQTQTQASAQIKLVGLRFMLAI